MARTPSPSSPPIRCRLEIPGDPRHLSQAITGFFELEAAGRVVLEAVEETTELSEDSAALRAVVEGRHVIYECTDGWNIPADLLAGIDTVDLYFKRSYDPRHRQDLPCALDLRPLGLNYHVISGRNRWHAGTRPLHPRRMLSAMLRRASPLASFAGLRDVRVPDVRDVEHLPTTHEPATVLFMTRTWGDVDRSVDAEMAREARAVDEARAELIRAARREFGARFFGGFAPSDHAVRHYPDCVLPSRAAARRRAYLARVHRSDVCVATTGLWDSIGWKMTEYVAASRAIVTEPLRHSVPGGFAAGTNYLEFASVDEFVDAVGTLLDDRERREVMMHANAVYYRRWVRPPDQVMRTLEQVLGDAPGPS